MDLFRVRFGDDNREVSVPANSLLSDVLKQHGIPLRADCGCAGTCGQCLIHVAVGHDDSGTEVGSETGGVNRNETVAVLACQYRIQNDLTVWIPNESREHEQVQIVVESGISVRNGGVNDRANDGRDDEFIRVFGPQQPQLTLISIERCSPTREDARDDWNRFVDSSLQLQELRSRISLEQLRSFAEKFRAANWRGKALILQNRLIDFFSDEECFIQDGLQFPTLNKQNLTTRAVCEETQQPSLPTLVSNPFFAVALDIGTTTLVAELLLLPIATQDEMERGPGQTGWEQHPLTQEESTTVGQTGKRDENQSGNETGNQTVGQTENRSNKLSELRAGYSEHPRIIETRVNPQKKFGDDIISRIQQVIENPGVLSQLQNVLLDSVAEMILQLAKKANIDPQQIVFVSTAGNTVMQQIFLGLDPSSLGFAPFVPITQKYPIILGSQLRLPIHPNGLVYVLPILGGFVGGDILAGILTCQLDLLQQQDILEKKQGNFGEKQGKRGDCQQDFAESQEKLGGKRKDFEDGQRKVASLLIDVGTNGEMVLATGNHLRASATAAGPAFEGARIRHGMIAAKGAIDRVEFGEQVNIGTIGDVEPLGICGSGLIDLIAELLRVGLITPTGQLLTELPDDRDVDAVVQAEQNGQTSNDTSSHTILSSHMPSRNTPLSETLKNDLRDRLVLLDGQPAFRLSKEKRQSANSRANHSPVPPKEVLLTQKDIRQVQLASGAIRSGVQLLLEQANVRAEDLQHLYLGGGFGRFIRPENAKRIGLFPSEIASDKIVFYGNTSLAGVRAIALDRSVQERAEQVGQRVEHVDLSTLPGFTQMFAESMMFPSYEMKCSHKRK
ncbi:MAG: ASKHA domain-containing protein [Thermoguttaceae bacterium]